MMHVDGSIQEKLDANLSGLIPTALLLTGVLYGLIPSLVLIGGKLADPRIIVLTNLNLITSLVCLSLFYWTRKNSVKPSMAHPLIGAVFLLILINTLLRAYWFPEQGLGIVFFLLVAAILVNSVRWFILIAGACVAVSSLIAFMVIDDPLVRTTFLAYPLIGGINGVLIFVVRFLSAVKSERVNLELENRSFELKQSNTQLTNLVGEKENLANSLAESEKKSRQLLDISPVAIVIHKDGIILWANPETIKLLGMRPDENISGTSVFEYMEKEAAHNFQEVLKARMSENSVVRPEIHSILRPNGQTAQVETTSLPFIFEGQSARVIFAKDITHQIDFEEALMKARDEALLASQGKSRFLSSMSHELRTPLNAVLGFCDLMLLDNHGELKFENRREYLEIIKQSGKHLLSLISDLLEIGAVDSGALQLEIGNHSLKKLVQECKLMVDQTLSAKNINIEIEVRDSIVIGADRIRARQVFFNLINNAIKYSPKNGRIIISAKDTEGGMIEICIQDSGPGIPEPDQVKIFSEFYRSPQNHQSEEKSTGIGLAVCKRLVEYHGGRIWVESAAIGGAKFRFTLPEGEVQKSQGVQTISSSNPRGSMDEDPDVLPKARILVVEDNSTNMLLVREVLLRNGQEVYEATNGEIAIRLAKVNLPDLILMDLEMPVMGGLEATRILRETPETGQIPIIALTAHADKNTAEICYQAGCNCVLSKPLDIDELNAHIDELFLRRVSV